MNITVSFTKEQLTVLNQALIELPYRLAAPLVSHINAEIQQNFDQRQDEDNTPTRAMPTSGETLNA